MSFWFIFFTNKKSNHTNSLTQSMNFQSLAFWFISKKLCACTSSRPWTPYTSHCCIPRASQPQRNHRTVLWVPHPYRFCAPQYSHSWAIVRLHATTMMMLKVVVTRWHLLHLLHLLHLSKFLTTFVVLPIQANLSDIVLYDLMTKIVSLWCGFGFGI